MLWIEDNVESIPAHPFFTNSIVDMASFVNIHEVIPRNAFLAFPSAQNEVELEGGAKSERLKHHFSQVKGDLDLQKVPKSIFIPNKGSPRKRQLC
jgi:hypothetical protein